MATRRLRTGRRRLLTIPTVVLAALLVTAGLPLLLPAALVVDLLRWASHRTPFMATRLLLFGYSYLLAELVGLIALGVAWLTAPTSAGLGRRRRLTAVVQRAWARWVFNTLCWVFGLRVRVEGDDQVAPGPILLLARHASIVDNLLPSQLVTRRHGIALRYVMKEELRWDPALDLAGSWLPNAFVRREGGDSDREVAAVAALAADLGPDEGVLIYPEGTRATPGRRERALAALARRNPRLHALADGLRHLLPPRLGGTLALLEATAADVVVLAHRGLDGFARVADVWRGGMVRTEVQVRFRRFPRSLIPQGRAERAAWLYGVWREMDEWVGGPVAVPAPRP